VPSNLLERCQRREDGAFDEFFELVRADLYGLAYAILRNHDDADEAMQESLLRAYRHLPTLQDTGKFPWWMMRLVVNQCKSQQIRSGARVFYPIDDTIDVPNDRIVGAGKPPESPRDAMFRKQMATDIEAAIQELPPKQRAAIVLFEVEDHSIREVAELLECSEGTVKFNIHEARKKLKQLLKEYLGRRTDQLREVKTP
jgi:RNA polymerase sigma-70 factor (ECF subfamily)